MVEYNLKLESLVGKQLHYITAIFRAGGLNIKAGLTFENLAYTYHTVLINLFFIELLADIVFATNLTHLHTLHLNCITIMYVNSWYH